MAHWTLRGTVRYTSKKPERLDRERGREYFTLTQQAGGIDALLAHCEIDDEHNVVRDVSLALRHADPSPLLFRTGFAIVYVGEEDVETAAGSFRARHCQVTDTAGNLPEEHPPYDVWCTADDDYLLLKARAGGYMQTHYELTELRRS
jgi:hypothetical protein